MLKASIIVCATVLAVVSFTFSQSESSGRSEAYVDSTGVLRWRGTDKEVSLFGVNYTTPFAYAYRAHKRLGLSLKKSIDLDVAQMSRLGLDAFRLHVWDKEISDKTGNVLQNEHLDLFDYLLAKLAEHGVKIILTPIAWWGNGWPEADEKTDGFSQGYSKPELLTNQNARQAQRNYLRQFVDHINPYRKCAYKDDPSIIAVEIINEPHHPDDVKVVTEYIDEMAGVLRAAGVTKPIFYNISENWSTRQANAVTRAHVDGVSFQWYPTGLGHTKMLLGNYLINVDQYAIPSDSVAGFDTKAKIVYEFETADVGASYMYPAIARSFREAGMQFATMFAYDPVQIAWSNTEYPTHFMNLLYTPSKALSLMIAGKAFHRLPILKSYGRYPGNNQFGDFRVSHIEDLSEMNSDSEFVYSNSTASMPKNPAALVHVAGCGSSSLVQYEGTGAYFLDKQENGIWRLEVYPDVLWIRDPFGPASMSRQVARLFWGARKMEIHLPNLGDGYLLRRAAGIQTKNGEPADEDTSVRPGIYWVTAKNVNGGKAGKYFSRKETFLEGLYIPPAPSPEISVVNRTTRYASESAPFNFRFQIASEKKISKAYLFVRRLGWRSFSRLELIKSIGFDYSVTGDPAMLRSGELEYCVGAGEENDLAVFPEGIRAMPGAWDFSTSTLWNLKVIGPQEPIVLLDATRDRKDFVFPQYRPSMRYSVDYKNGPTSESVSLSIKVLFSGQDATPFGVQLSIGEIIRAMGDGIKSYRNVVVTGRSLQDSTCFVGVVFSMADGRSFGIKTELDSTWQGKELPLSGFGPANSLVLPESYPHFLPKMSRTELTFPGGLPDLRALQSIEIVADTSMARGRVNGKEIGFEIVSVSLTP